MSWCRDGRCARSEGCGGLSCFTAAAQRDPLQKPGVGGGAMSTTTRHRGTATLARMRRTASPPVRALQHEFASLEKTRGNAQHLKCILKFPIVSALSVNGERKVDELKVLQTIRQS